MQTAEVTGNIARILRNKDGLYQGNLEYYLKPLMTARNVNAPYHNLRHMLHVLYQCHDALVYYKKQNLDFNPIEARNLLVAALFHDYDHTGRTSNDDINIQLAIRGFRREISNEDRGSVDDICQLILLTEQPQKVASDRISPTGRILRDADVSQVLSPVWIQQVLGLAIEMDLTTRQMLVRQGTFLRELSFKTAWAKEKYSQALIDAKIAETDEILAIYDFSE